MNSILVGLFTALSLLVPAHAHAEVVPVVEVSAPIIEIYTPVITVVHSTSTPKEYIEKYAKQYHVSASVMLKVLTCESKLKSVQSVIHKKGGPNGREDSWGVAQIHLPAHRDITKAQALDPEFAIEWTAKQFALGKEYQWTCYRDIYGD